MAISHWYLAFAMPFVVLLGCDDDNEGSSAAVRLGVGAECTTNGDCSTAAGSCLTQFKGGYCGLVGCTGDLDCPAGSACVAHDDGVNYCFLICVDKTDCNVYRSVDSESNCVSSVSFVDNATANKACVPPSGT